MRGVVPSAASLLETRNRSLNKNATLDKNINPLESKIKGQIFPKQVPHHYGCFKIFQKNFFGLFCFLLASSYSAKFVMGSVRSIRDWLNVFLTTVAIIGFFSYIYKKKIGKALFWESICSFFIGWDFYLNVIINKDYSTNTWIFFIVPITHVSIPDPLRFPIPRCLQSLISFSTISPSGLRMFTMRGVSPSRA